MVSFEGPSHIVASSKKQAVPRRHFKPDLHGIIVEGKCSNHCIAVIGVDHAHYKDYLVIEGKYFIKIK